MSHLNAHVATETRRERFPGEVVRNRVPSGAPQGLCVAVHAGGEAGRDGLTVHDLRHTAAGRAVDVGATVIGLQQMLSHGSAAVTLDPAGLCTDDLEALTDSLPRTVATSND